MEQKLSQVPWFVRVRDVLAKRQSGQREKAAKRGRHLQAQSRYGCMDDDHFEDLQRVTTVGQRSRDRVILMMTSPTVRPLILILVIETGCKPDFVVARKF